MPPTQLQASKARMSQGKIEDTYFRAHLPCCLSPYRAIYLLINKQT